MDETITPLTPIESIAVSGILEELQNHLEAYKHVLSLQDDVNSRMKRENSIVDKLLRRDGSVMQEVPLEELEYLKELDELRELIGSTKLKTKEKDDPDEVMELKRHAEALKIQKDLDFLLEVISTTKTEIQSQYPSSISPSSSSPTTTKNPFAYLQLTLKEEADRINKESILLSSLSSKQREVKELQREILKFEKESLARDREQMYHIKEELDDDIPYAPLQSVLSQSPST